MFIFPLPAYECKDIFVSLDGLDVPDCGNASRPCRSINYTITVVVSSGDRILLEASSTPYVIKRSIVIKKDFTLAGYKGKPMIRIKKGSSDQDTVLFRFSKFNTGTKSVVVLQNLFFFEIGALTLNGNIETKVDNCVFERAPFAAIFIQSGYINVTINNSTFLQCRYTLFAENFNRLTLSVEASLIYGSPAMTKNYSGIVIFPNNCEFQSPCNIQVEIQDTKFTQVCQCVHVGAAEQRAALGGTVSFLNTNFYANGIASASSKFCGSPVDISLVTASFIDSTFIDNIAVKGGAIRAKSSTVNIKNSRFIGNVALSQGGAYHHQATKTAFDQCHFEMNRASSHQTLNEFNAIGIGGAIFNGPKSNSVLTDCTFQENSADSFGGTIYNAPNAVTLKLINSSLIPRRKPPYYAIGGEVLYSAADVQLQNITIDASQGFPSYPSQRVLILHLNYYKLTATSKVRIQCPLGWNISITALYGPQKSFELLATSCSSCPPNYYNLNSGYVLLSQNFSRGYMVHPIQCLPCPYGGRCKNGSVRPQNNFWGNKVNTLGNIKFIRCPIDYCCRGDECQSFNSCHGNRKGTLCGQCKEGFSEDMLTSDCFPNHKCEKGWFWIIFVIAGVFYVIIFMYLKEIGNCLGKIFDFKSVFQCDEDASDSLSTPLISHESVKQTFSLDNVSSHIVGTRKSNARNKGRFSGFIKITFFFYQIEALFSLSQLSEGSGDNVHRIIWGIREVCSSLFNFKVTGMYHNTQSLCPYSGQEPVTKEFFKMIFMSYIITILGLLALLLSLCRSNPNVEEIEQSKTSFRTRILCSLLETLILGYAVLTTSCMSLLRCKSLDNIGKVLYIDGNITCYTWWQVVLFALLISWNLPFPLALYFASRGLLKNKLSLKTFFIGLALPLPFIIYSIFSYCSDCNQSEESRVLRGSQSSDDLNSSSNHCPSDITKVLNVLYGPFRKSRHLSDKIKHPYHWEAVLIFRRLLLICVFTFTDNPVVQQYIMLLMLCFFLIHHVFIMPFDSRILNVAETISLTSLCILCSISIVPAYNYAYPITHSKQFDHILQVFYYAQAFLLIAVPLLIIVSVCIAIFLRLVHIFWLILKCIGLTLHVCYRMINYD